MNVVHKLPDDFKPFDYRAVQCPECKTVSLIRLDQLTRVVSCACGCKFTPAENLVLTQTSTHLSPYAVWACPTCKRKLLIPAAAIKLPAKCPCGEDYPFKLSSRLEWGLEPIESCALGDDPFLIDNLERSYRAAQQYHYDLKQVGSSCYRVTNPTNGHEFMVKIGSIGEDTCECDVFLGGGDTCIHIEHVRQRLRLLSSSQEFIKARSFAYVWFDKMCLPPRITDWLVWPATSKERGKSQVQSNRFRA